MTLYVNDRESCYITYELSSSRIVWSKLRGGDCMEIMDYVTFIFVLPKLFLNKK